ncbi:MAG: hypothetical protein MUF56_00640 [Solirubrobacteraceae bacterium]|nr:hypothetical protein [Solirubrobacteraceae bacterium]
MTDVAPAERHCPSTKRSAKLRLGPGELRPSDMLTAFLGAGVAWIFAGAAAGLAYALGGAEDLRWLALHCAFVGGVSQLIVGAGQFFACAFLACAPPGRRLVRAELATWNAGAAAIAVGVPLDLVWLTGLGGTLVLAGTALYAGGLVALRKRSIQRRPWATRWYLTAAACLAVGAVLGPVLASDTVWTRGSLLGAHLALNLGGWFGLTIAGTLHTFYPSLTGTRLRWARLEEPAFWTWAPGVVLLSAGAAWNSDALGIAGWALLTLAGALIAVNLIASARAATQRPPAMLVVSLAQVLLVVTLAAGLVSAIQDGPLAGLVGADRDALALLLIGGWVGLTVAGSLLHLLWLMGRVRTPGISPRGLPRERVAVAGAAIAAAGLLLTAAGAPAAALIVAGYALLAARIAPLALRAVRAAPLRM